MGPWVVAGMGYLLLPPLAVSLGSAPTVPRRVGGVQIPTTPPPAMTLGNSVDNNFRDATKASRLRETFGRTNQWACIEKFSTQLLNLRRGVNLGTEKGTP